MSIEDICEKCGKEFNESSESDSVCLDCYYLACEIQKDIQDGYPQPTGVTRSP